jgi:bifunctional non-homologous end joining protein LigD
VDGELRYAGKVGTGFDARTLRALRARLEPLEVGEPPFVDPPRGVQRKRARWVRPELVVEVTFSERTRDGRLRHPVFVGVREDKPARRVGAERVGAEVGPVRLSSPEKVYYPGVGVTKRELAEYYQALSSHVLAHVADRALALVRCPEGIAGHCFYQKHVFEGMPPAIRAVRVKEGRDAREHTSIHDVAGLLSLVQIGVLEIHAWGSRVDRIEQPDRLVFDLDPGEGVPWSGIVEAALAVRERLEGLGLASFVKTTGGKGLHVVVPTTRRMRWDHAKAFTRAVATDLSRRWRGRYTTSPSKAARKGKVFLDYLRNSRGATAVAAYSSRAREGAPVSTPLAWEELGAEGRSDSFGVREIPARLRSLRRDPWEGFFAVRQTVTKAMRAEVGLSD